jgi:hypothetical protein
MEGCHIDGVEKEMQLEELLMRGQHLWKEMQRCLGCEFPKKPSRMEDGF